MGSGGFGPILSALLVELEVSNQELARRMNLDGSQVRKWRSGKVDPTWATLQRIADALRVDPVRLLKPADGPGAAAGDRSIGDPALEALIPRARTRAPRGKRAGG